jgi:hypothetical protein
MEIEKTGNGWRGRLGTKRQINEEAYNNPL